MLDISWLLCINMQSENDFLSSVILSSSIKVALFYFLPYFFFSCRPWSVSILLSFFIWFFLVLFLLQFSHKVLVLESRLRVFENMRPAAYSSAPHRWLVRVRVTASVMFHIYPNLLHDYLYTTWTFTTKIEKEHLVSEILFNHNHLLLLSSENLWNELRYRNTAILSGL